MEGLEAGLLDGADVDEEVRSSAFGRDETISLLRVEKLHCAGRHGHSPFSLQPRLARSLPRYHHKLIGARGIDTIICVPCGGWRPAVAVQCCVPSAGLSIRMRILTCVCGIAYAAARASSKADAVSKESATSSPHAAWPGFASLKSLTCTVKPSSSSLTKADRCV